MEDKEETVDFSHITQIAPCPFCGANTQDVIIHRTRGATCHFNAQVKCRKCGARGPIASSPKTDWRCTYSDEGRDWLSQQAIILWNNSSSKSTRTDDLPLFSQTKITEKTITEGKQQ